LHKKVPGFSRLPIVRQTNERGKPSAVQPWVFPGQMHRKEQRPEALKIQMIGGEVVETWPKAAKSRRAELELVDVASRQTLKNGSNPEFLPRAAETILLPLGPESWAPQVLTLDHPTNPASLKRKRLISKSQPMRNASADFRSTMTNRE